MTTITYFTLRPLERNPPGTLLEGAFRVHLPIKELKALKLSTGDLIRIVTQNGPKGIAIAWLANQTNPGNKPIAKVTDLLRDKYGLSITNDRIAIEKVENADDEWIPIKTIEVGFESGGSPSGYSSTEDLLFWTRQALADLEVILPDCTFDVQRKGPRTRPAKSRLIVRNIDPVPDFNRPLYFDPATSQVIFSEGSSNLSLETKQLPTASEKVPQLSSDGIGGLNDHIGTINRNLLFLTKHQPTIKDQHLLRLIGPTAFLIHGPEGTGKSMLLNRLAQCEWKGVYKVDPASSSKTPGKDITEAFEKARENQPSLVLFDDLDKLLGKGEALISRLKTELGKLEGARVAVAAAARSVYDIDTSLRTTSGFKIELEIFPPNVRQREGILRQILGPDRPLAQLDLTSLSEKTHGFVGRDLLKLCGLAINHHIQATCSALQPDDNTSLGDFLQGKEFISQSDFVAVIDQVQPTVLKDSILEVPKVRWTDIAGLGHVQKLLEEIMIRPIKFPDLYLKFGGAASRKGVLLYGPPGCAKTLIAQAVATESNQNFLAVKGSELIKMYVGESERAIRDVFRRARAAKPCIIFFDEIDSIGKSREKSQDSGLNVVTTLLNEMDGIEALKEVFIIGATNRPDILDSALIRPGRFDAHIHIGLPNEDARKQIFEIHTRKMPLAGDVDLGILASRTQDYSGADIKALCSITGEMGISDYTQNPSPDNTPEIRMCHFERALAEHSPHTVKEEADRYKNWRPGKSLSAI
ncbi:AAA-domain-containing protein [Westerdykella ornata]|uniref:AAA-domain-containing protein n=1 Tax=Westerdykella ornata TaxID=318751 RepID=A0A6A6JZ88_WESOR|nr:AAA-domain-containing protein [Westerdykella ornata]KAF2281544.1 AAA-domain-containing protein [Westerdykella ornata]